MGQGVGTCAVETQWRKLMTETERCSSSACTSVKRQNEFRGCLPPLTAYPKITNNNPFSLHKNIFVFQIKMAVSKAMDAANGLNDLSKAVFLILDCDALPEGKSNHMHKTHNSEGKGV